MHPPNTFSILSLSFIHSMMHNNNNNNNPNINYDSGWSDTRHNNSNNNIDDWKEISLHQKRKSVVPEEEGTNYFDLTESKDQQLQQQQQQQHHYYYQQKQKLQKRPLVVENGKTTTTGNKSKNVLEEPKFLILAGIPGSGKSTFASRLAASDPRKYTRISQDELGRRDKCENACRRALRNGKCPIIDRCNFDPRQRKHFLDIALEFSVPVDCIIFRASSIEECIVRCQNRENHETIDRNNAKMVVHRMAKMFLPPKNDNDKSKEQEPFRNIRMVSSFRESNQLLSEYLNIYNDEKR
mmetsp:Transcript_21225/g.29739  ORF Transcript_21225/g.29739 Transcript_21225/m.29739 type:complete len:296 (-) Transcript_21225:102-989(-)